MYFKDGDKIAMIGDSITADGKYHLLLTDYYFTRYPMDKVRFFNLGISGGTTEDAILRYSWDIQPKQCNKAFVMFGMNDINCNLFAKDVCKDNGKLQKEAVEKAYIDLEHLTQLLNKDESEEIIMMSPTPYEQLSELEAENCFGADGSLKKVASFVKKYSKDNGYTFVDLRAAMLRENTKLRKKDASLSLVGADRVHPGYAGHALMASVILKTLGEGKIVSEIVYNYEDKNINRMINMRAEQFIAKKGDLEFIYKPNSLPLYLEEECKPYLSGFNQEMIGIIGLKKGKYRLLLDRCDAGVYSDVDFKNGVNIAQLDANPNYQRSRYIHELNKKRAEYVYNHRISKNFLIKLKNAGIDLKNKKAVEKAVESYRELYKNAEYYEFVKEMFYQFEMGTDDGFLLEIEQKYEEIYHFNKPIGYQVEIVCCN